MASIRVAVIGGGPGGLVTLKTLLEASTPDRRVEASLFEAEDDIGGTFRYRSYENAELVSSKQLTAFSDHRFPLDFPDHVPIPEYVKYLQSYVDRFNLAQHIKLRCRVTKIAPIEHRDQKWKHRVAFVNGATGEENVFECSHIAICTGLHVEPNMPTIPGTENLKGEWYHSSQYKARRQLVGRDVLILGCGETAMDIAYEAVQADAHSVTMCFRTGFLSFPKALSRFQVFGRQFTGGLPIDTLITNLFETAYVHHAIAHGRIRWLVSDSVLKRVVWFLTGTQAGVNQHVGELPPEKLGRAYVFLNKSNKAMPFLNRPYDQRNWFRDLIGNKYIEPPESANSNRWVDTCSFPSHIDSNGTVVFEPRSDRKDWQRMKSTAVRPNCVIYCTGYKQDFLWLDSSYPRASDANIRNIVHASHPDIAFIGFVRPGVGAIPPITEQQAMWWTSLILERMALPTSAPHYHLLVNKGARVQYGVDHSSYMSTLGRDFGGSPDLVQLYRCYGLRVLLIYCFGASFTTFYRLLGPFRFPEAEKIATTELQETIMRRGVVGNLFFGVIPMAFYGLVNAVAWMLEVCGLLAQEGKVV